MTFEEALAALAANTARIAAALESLTQAQGIVPDEMDDAQGQLFDTEEKPAKKKKAAKPEAEEKPAKKKKAAKPEAEEEPEAEEKPAKKKKAAKPEAEEKPAKKKKGDLTIADDVRPVMKRVRAALGPDAVMDLLERYNATTLQMLDEKDYAAIIADAEEDLS